MSFLAPLYALGLLAVAAPIWFHLVRRRPKGRVPFSSLLFLTASPPPPAQKRRLDQLLLLLLRITALVLLGFAFMRPFLRTEAAADAGGAGQRVLILIDTSASLRRGDLWAQAVAQADDAVAKVRPADRVGVWAFDTTVRPVLSFHESPHLDAGQASAVARQRLNELKPTWGGTELGPALIDAVAAILSADTPGGRKAGKVVLISDLPQGAKLTGLNAFEWPADVELELRTVTDDGGNAGPDLLPDRVDSEKGELRVRVVNDADSRQERFRLGWTGQPTIETYVPPGGSRVVKVPRPAADAKSPTLRLTGDAHDFDNTIHFAVPPREEMRVYFVGPDAADDPAGLRYFLDRAWGDTAERTVRVQTVGPSEPLAAADVRPSPLVVVHGEASAEATRVLQQYLRDGGTVLSVLTQAGPAKTLTELAGVPLDVSEAKAGQYTMLQQIAFDHPLFAPLAGPQFGDFTKVHFWEHRRLLEAQLAGGRVLARFDDGDAAVWEKAVGKGRLVVFASGWHPADGQLARSTKFVPLMTALLELRGGRAATSVSARVGDRVAVPTGGTAVRKPDGSGGGGVWGFFAAPHEPGVYAFETPTGLRPLAVNLDPAESLTAPLPVETLEQLGCKIAKPGDADRREAFERQQRDVELERSQSIWRGLILAAVFVLIFETALAGWRGRSARREGVAT